MKYHRIIPLKNGLEAGNPDSPIVLVQPVDDHDLEEMEAEVSEIQRLTSMYFCLIAVKVRSWNQDLSHGRHLLYLAIRTLAMAQRIF